jgi:hypothetical protein
MGPRTVLVVAAALGLMSGVAVVSLALRGSEPGPAAVEARTAEPYAVRVLRAWDARRSRAYAHADGAALADLYVAGSRTGAADRAVLLGYRDRGLRVTGMRTQVLAARVLRESGRRLVLLVTDVLVEAVAGDARRARWALPHDRPSTRRVVLVRDRGTWRVAEVYRVAGRTSDRRCSTSCSPTAR